MMDKSITHELARLAQGYVNSDVIDARQWSKEVLKQAYIIGLIEKSDNRKWQFCNNFDFALMMNADVLWELTKEMFSEYSGYSIVRSKQWNKLNIYNEGNHFFSNNDIQSIENILNELALGGYIWFNCAGKVWHITIKGE